MQTNVFVVSSSVKERHAVALLPRRGFKKFAKICMRLVTDGR